MQPEKLQHPHLAPEQETTGHQPVPQGYEQTAYLQQPYPATQPAWQSPVARHAQSWPQGMHHQPQKSYAWLWALIGGVGALVVGAVIFYALQAGSDPFRTLQEFPAESYLRNHEGLMGSRFRAEMTLEAELGAEIGRGRMFSFREKTSGRIVPVLVLDSAGLAAFDKGQRYLLELEVRQGGLIQASACKKS